MRHVLLTVCDDEYGSGLGFHLAKTPKYDGFMVDTTGFMIAHDLLEHQNGAQNIGPVWDEMEALGSVWHLRGRHGDFLRGEKTRNLFTPEETIAADLVHMYSSWDGWNGPGSMNTKPHEHDESFDEIIEYARRDIPKGYGSYPGNDFSYAEMESYLTLARHRLRTGYNKSRRRFGDHWYDGPELFCRIRDAVADAIREIEYEGQEFRLSYGKGQAYVQEVFPEY